MGEMYRNMGIKPLSPWRPNLTRKLLLGESESKEGVKKRRQSAGLNNSSTKSMNSSGHFSDDSENEMKEEVSESEEPEDDPYIHKIDVFPPSFFSFRRRKLEMSISQENKFESLPDEMILKVLKWLHKPSLGRLARVSKRFNRLVVDETLWKNIDVMCRILQKEALPVIIERSPVNARFSRATIYTEPGIEFPFSPQLTRLDLSMANIQYDALAALFNVTPNLSHLSLEHVPLSHEVIEAMKTFAPKIKVLNLTMCYDVEPIILSKFLKNTKFLTELNIGCLKAHLYSDTINWTNEEMVKVAESLPGTIRSLNVCGFRKLMNNTHVELITKNCPHLIDFDLSDSQEITMVAVEAITTLEYLQHLSLSRCYAIEASAYSLLRYMKSLRHVELFSLFKDSSLKSLRSSMPNLSINAFPYSVIGRPTVMLKRSSIWGARVRD